MDKILSCKVIVNLDIAGVHFWASCDLDEVSYLQYRHRHMFKITAKKTVTDADRQIEIIMFKNEITKWLNVMYYCEKRQCLDFGQMSCEMIAEKLVKVFQLDYCRVLEDGENGAEVEITTK